LNDKYIAIDFGKPIIANNKIFCDGHNYKIYIRTHHIHTISWSPCHLNLVYLIASLLF